MGHLRKRGKKKYQIVIELDPDPDGSRNFIYKTVNCKKAKAKDILQEMERDLKEGTYSEKDFTLKEHLTDWLESYQKKIKPRTYESYKMIINKHILPELGQYTLDKIIKKPKIIEDYYDYKLEKGRLNGEGGLSNRSVRYHHSILHNALGAAVKWKRIKVNPVDMVEPPKKITKEAEYLNSKQLNKLLEAENVDYYKRIFEFAARTGMRRGEILGLQWNLVDLENDFIKVKQSLLKINKELVLQENTKNNLIRNIPISSKTRKILKEIKAKQAEAKLLLGKNYNENDLVFIRENGDLPHPDTITQRFKGTARKAGFENVKFHSLRHSFASIMKQNGEDLQVIQKLLGHTLQSTTADIYSHIPAKSKEDAVKRMDKIL